MRPRQIEIIPASLDQQPVLANLLELYVHDFSEFFGVELGPDGRFGYPQLPLYWTEPGRYPYLIRLDGKLAGFALIKREADKWDMAEFFLLRAHRRRGIGTEIAHNIWRRLPGTWEVRVMEANAPGLAFWKRAISQFTGKPADAVRAERNGRTWQVFTFMHPAGSAANI